VEDRRDGEFFGLSQVPVCDACYGRMKHLFCLVVFLFLGKLLAQETPGTNAPSITNIPPVVTNVVAATNPPAAATNENVSPGTNEVVTTNAPANLTNLPAGTNIVGNTNAVSSQTNAIVSGGTNAVPGTNGEAQNHKLKPQPDVMKTFRTKAGFRIEMVASEPLVASPIAMAFDESGRLFVVESNEDPRLGGKSKGLVRVLEDKDGDGIFDSSSVYADNLDRPAGIVCYGGGVFVGTAGEILFLKDTKGDGVADARRAVYKGFSASTNKLANSLLFNGLAWGLNNRIYVTTEGHGGDIISGTPPSTVSLVLKQGNFSFDPRTFQLFAESGSSQLGICFDNRGRGFVSYTNAPVLLLMYDLKYALRDEYFDIPGPILDVAGNGAAGLLYPIQGPRAAVAKPAKLQFPYALPAKMQPARSEYGAVHFTSAGGTTIYRGSLYGEQYEGDAFVADAVAGVVHREKLMPDGVELVAARPLDESRNEFLAGNPETFRPRQVTMGPDGAIYIADMGGAAADSAAQTGASTNATSVQGHGHIYRILPVGFKQPKLPALGKANGTNLVLALMSPNGWYRDTAARLLYEKQDKGAIGPLVQLVYSQVAPPLGRMHALYVLEGMNLLVDMHVQRALQALDDRVREHAIKLSENLLPRDGVASPVMWNELAGLASDPAPLVRYQLGFSLGPFRNAGRNEVLANLLKSDGGSKWMQTAVMTSVADGTAEVLGVLVHDATVRNSIAGQEFLQRLMRMLTARNNPAEIASVITTCRNLPEPDNFGMLRLLGDYLRGARTTLVAADGSIAGLLARARVLARDVTVPENRRIPAILFLQEGTFAESEVVLYDRVELYESAQIQSATLMTLARFSNPQIAQLIVTRWAFLKPYAHKDAVVALLNRPEWTRHLLAGIESRAIAGTELSSAQVLFLLGHPDQDIRARAARLFVPPVNRAQRLETVIRLLPAAQLSGVANRGRVVFFDRCASCHRVGQDGNIQGWDLAQAASWSRDKLIAKIVNPNEEINTDGMLRFIPTTDGELLIGFISRQSARSISLCQENGAVRFLPRFNIQAIQELGVSAMPDGLEAGLSPQLMADLVQYIVSAPR
jgi:putative membrane-bound dehydrogenase-like protein